MRFFVQVLIETNVNMSSKLIFLGPVVQSIVSLTSSLRGQLVKTLFYDFITKYTDMFVAKMREVFALQKLLAFLQQKILANFRY